VSQPEEERVQTPKTLKDFGRAVGVHLPRRLSQLRALGKSTRALGSSKPRK